MKSYNVVCAAFDTPGELKEHADFICDETDARPVLQNGINEAGMLRVKCILLPGTYVINSRNPENSRGAIVFYNHQPPAKIYAHNTGFFQTLEGGVESLGWQNGAIIKMGRELYAELDSEEPFSLFYADGNDLFARAWTFRNLVVQLPANQKAVVVFDGRYCSALTYENIWMTAVEPTSFNYATAEGIPVPHPESVGFRGTAGSNFAARNEWRNLIAIGFGTGFDIGGEHVYCESLSALYNIYGFAFNCYRGKHSIMDADNLERGPWGCFYPISCVNLLDEHNVNMPRFGHEGWSNHMQPITIHGMNLQWPNTCPGHTSCLQPDFLEGRSRAVEDLPGSWRGTIEYMIDRPTENHCTNLQEDPFFETGHGENILVRNLISKP